MPRGQIPAADALGYVSEAAVNGVATFSSLSINHVGTGYTLRAKDGSLISIPSASFNAYPGSFDNHREQPDDGLRRDAGH